MGQFKHKRVGNGYAMTSVNLRKEERVILTHIMKKEGMKMGEVIRAAIQRLGREYGVPP